MFDLGFTEMLLIAAVALLVLGPERLPKAARALGEWVGRMQRYVNDVKSDINREIELSELRKFHDDVKGAASSFENTIRSEVASVESSFTDPFALPPAASGGGAAPDYEARAALACVRPSYVPRPDPERIALGAAPPAERPDRSGAA
jgi:sec-independent protein translocase protein TatB